MKISIILASCEQHLGRWRLGRKLAMSPALALVMSGAAVAVGGGLASAQSEVTAPAQASPLTLAQVYPAPPAPQGETYANVGGLPTAGEQYIVYIPGSDTGLLDQVRLLEPAAFPTVHQGQSVIQVGRFSYYQNAQQQVNVLSGQGIGAAIAAVAPAQPTFTQVPTPPPSGYINPGELPPLPVVAVPQGSAPAPAAPVQNVAFGQPPVVPTAAYPSAPSSVDMPPPSSTSTPTAAVPVAQSVEGAPFYVVIPASASDLPTISSRLIQLGTPADRVQQRTGGLGPNVAVGPFRDRGLAERWNGFFREAGYGSSRVVYQP